MARLRDGTTREQASAELKGIARGIASENPDLYRRGTDDVGYALDVVGLHDLVTLIRATGLVEQVAVACFETDADVMALVAVAVTVSLFVQTVDE